MGVGQDERMPTTRSDDTLIDVVRILVLLQGGIAVVSTIEVLVVGAVLGAPLVQVFLLTGGGALLTLSLAAGLVRRSRRARRLVVVLEVLWLIAATIDLLLSVFMARRGLELVPILTRIALPYAIFRLLRRPHMREAFGVRQSRRRRRKARRNDERHSEDAQEHAAAALEMSPV